MKAQEHVKREPLIHITKRDAVSWKKALLIRALAILCALLFSALMITLLAGKNPLKIYASMFSGAFGTPRRIWNLLNSTCILLGIGLAVTPAFRMKFWNCGAEGQVLMGALAAAGCMHLFGDALPLPLFFVVMTLVSILAGAIWAVIPAIFKAFFNTNETLFTLMMNYIATQLVLYLLKVWVKTGSGVLTPMPQFRFPHIGDNEFLLAIFVILAICALLYVYLRYSKQGYEISVVGESENTAKYIGINVKKVIIRTMILSGALCGVIGLLLVANGSCTVNENIVGGQGFTAIMVSWLAKFNPLYMILTAFLIIFLQRGSAQIVTDFRVHSSIGDIVTGIILLFIIGCEFFLHYKVHFRKKAKEEQNV